jgi:hypothetical protein
MPTNASLPRRQSHDRQIVTHPGPNGPRLDPIHAAAARRLQIDAIAVASLRRRIKERPGRTPLPCPPVVGARG